jgi:FlaA1/EpsC-like NDP-sugar epimerase
VVPTFERQIEAGGPVTVTDPSMTRFFMSVDEAVRFVLHAATLADEDGVLALDMGERVNIHELAERMIRLAGYRAGHDIEIRITGPRPGENTTESVVGADEVSLPCADRRVTAISPTRLAPDVLEETIERLREIIAAGDDARARAVLLGVAASVHVHA